MMPCNTSSKWSGHPHRQMPLGIVWPHVFTIVAEFLTQDRRSATSLPRRRFWGLSPGGGGSCHCCGGWLMSSARAPVVQARPCATLPRGKGPAPLEDGYRAMSAHQRIFTDRGGGQKIWRTAWENNDCELLMIPSPLEHRNISRTCLSECGTLATPAPEDSNAARPRWQYTIAAHMEAQ